MTTARLTVMVGLLCLGVVTAPAAAQDIARVPNLAGVQDIERVRTLYVAAAYEEALAAMPLVEGEASRPDFEQYRALCLLALGREKEAVATVERLVRDNPLFLPPAGDTSPRMQSIFAGVRSKLVPDMARRSYAEAKAAYGSMDRAGAHAAFQRTLDLIESLPDAEEAALSDLRLLAGEFLELSAARPAPPADLTSPPGYAPAKVVPTGEFVPAAAVREQLPQWNPPDGAARRREYTGLLRILIGDDGRVRSATMVKSSHPAYDVATLNAAKQWLYKPATRGGVPVGSQKDIQVRLVPQ